MKMMKLKGKIGLSIAVLSTLTFSTAYADISSDGSTVTQTVTDLDAGQITAANEGTITINASNSVTMERAYASSAGIINIGSTSGLVPKITAEGEILAENSGSTINLYGDVISLTKGDDYTAAVTSQSSAVINIGTSSSTSITTSGEVLASGGTIAMQAENITMNYNASADSSSSTSGGEDNTAMADEGGSLTITAGDELTIEGPVGATGDGSSVTLLGNTIEISHNTLTTVKDDPESRGVYAEDGGTVTIGSDDTEELTIDVENDSDESSIVVSGNESTLSLYGKTISITTADGILNGNIESDTPLETDYAGGTLNIGSDDTSSLAISGILRTVGEGANTTLLGSSITADDVAAYHEGTITIGSASTDTVSLAALWALYDSTATVLGDSITIEAETYERNGQELTDGYSVHSNDGSTVTIGSDDTTKVTVEGHVEVDGADLTIKGNEIVIGTTGTLDLAIEQRNGGTVAIGDDATESVLINSAILIEGDDGNNVMTITGDTVTLNGMINMFGSDATLSVDGTNITLTEDESIDPSDFPYAISAMWGSVMSLGSSRTESLSIAGQVAAWAIEDGVDTEVYLDGNTITLQNGALATGNGAVITIGGAGVTETLSGDLTATDGGTITATLSGAYIGDATAEEGGTVNLTAGSVTGTLTATGSGSTLTADVSGLFTGNASATDSGTLTLTAGSVVGNLSTSDSGTLTATVSSTFTGTTTDDADTMTLNMESGSTWNLTDSSTVSTLNAAGANINLLDGTLGQTLTTDTFDGDGTTVYLDADGTTNTGNDRVYITGTHTGTTSLHLASTSDTWSGALDTVLVSVGDEQGSFVSDGETEAALYYYDLVLASTTENVTDGYNTDWYLAGFTKEATNSEGHHTTVVRNLGGITGSNYLLWRSDMDTLFRRLGETDNSLTENTDDGIWVRAKGKKFSRVSDFLVDSKYNEYEAGYDWLHDKTDKNEHVAGVGIAYLDGDSTYVSGKGDLTGYTLGLYDTTVWKDGQYLDLVLKGSRYKNEFGYRALGRYVDGKSDSTGLSLGAEYGYKRKTKSGWYVEPQAQFVLGYFRNDDFTDSNGVHVDNETIRTAIGRIGMRAGYEDKKLSAYAKANWYHDFGGNHVTNMSVGTDSLRVHEDYGDTWFAYGLGAAYKMNDKAQLYFDLERGDGSTYDENWSWDVGVKFSF